MEEKGGEGGRSREGRGRISPPEIKTNFRAREIIKVMYLHNRKVTSEQKREPRSKLAH